MGTVYADIELINAIDLGMVQRHQMDKDEVRRIRVNMLADSGAYMMAINENIFEQLGLTIADKRKAVMADGSIVEYDVAGPIEVRFSNRKSVCNAFVLPGDGEPLLGSIPMEEMDVLIHPLRQELVVNPEHPDYAVLKMK